jgi:hypothetical protein
MERNPSNTSSKRGEQPDHHHGAHTGLSFRRISLLPPSSTSAYAAYRPLVEQKKQPPIHPAHRPPPSGRQRHVRSKDCQAETSSSSSISSPSTNPDYFNVTFAGASPTSSPVAAAAAVAAATPPRPPPSPSTVSTRPSHRRKASESSTTLDETLSSSYDNASSSRSSSPFFASANAPAVAGAVAASDCYPPGMRETRHLTPPRSPPGTSNGRDQWRCYSLDEYDDEALEGDLLGIGGPRATAFHLHTGPVDVDQARPIVDCWSDDGEDSGKPGEVEPRLQDGSWGPVDVDRALDAAEADSLSRPAQQQEWDAVVLLIEEDDCSRELAGYQVGFEPPVIDRVSSSLEDEAAGAWKTRQAAAPAPVPSAVARRGAGLPLNRPAAQRAAAAMSPLSRAGGVLHNARPARVQLVGPATAGTASRPARPAHAVRASTITSMPPRSTGSLAPATAASRGTSDLQPTRPHQAWHPPPPPTLHRRLGESVRSKPKPGVRTFSI